MGGTVLPWVEAAAALERSIPFGGGNGLQLAAQAVADGLYMGTVAVAADARAEDRLRQIVADVQPELDQISSRICSVTRK